VFPAFSIGLASYLAMLEGLWLVTGRDVYLQVFKYWLRIFALVFGMGVVSGIVFRFRRHGGHVQTCRWFAPVANDPTATWSVRRCPVVLSC
jgi:cytochrome bd-type quinol oxidase subunit 1